MKFWVPDNSLPLWTSRVSILCAFCVALGAYSWMYLDWLPNGYGQIGYDYAYFLPQLLDGWYWASTNGVLSVPWFTPSFCGGIPAFANPQNVYFSAPQLLTLLLDPLAALQVNFILFGGIAFWGMYLCCHAAFDCSRPASILAATIFLFNGFFVSRYLMGHLTFHVFALLPWVAYFALRTLAEIQPCRRLQYWTDCSAIGLLVAYMIFSGAAIIIPLMLLSLISLELIRDIQAPGYDTPIGRLFAGVALGVVLAAPKIVAGVSVAEWLPRDHYPLAGLSNLGDLLTTIFASLFLTDGFGASRGGFTNDVHPLGPHEFRYGMTLVPAILFAFVAVRVILERGVRVWRIIPSRGLWPLIALLIALLVPAALNYFAPEWHAFLKRTPFIRNSTTLLRWFAVYILPVCLLTALAMDYLGKRPGGRLTVAALAFLAVIMLKGVEDSEFTKLHDQAYDPSPVTTAYRAHYDGTSVPNISEIRKDPRNAEGQRNLAANNALIKGKSQLSCYEPMFGFRLEKFPHRTLHTGSVYEAKDGLLNIKNPACYAFPEANSCRPGDHFKVSERRSAELFAARKPYPFSRPKRQIIANWISLTTILLVLLSLATHLIANRHKLIRPPYGLGGKQDF
jgi:hypothetical protein